MARFKVGNRVALSDGRKGTVVEIYLDPEGLLDIKVQLDDGHSGWCMEKYLKKAVYDLYPNLF